MPPASVLALFAHPDDETLACGGTLAGLARQGAAVTVVIVGDGVVTARQAAEPNKVNREDAAAACQALGLHPPQFLDFPDQRLDTVAVSDIINAVRGVAPEADLVISHADTDLNADHRIVSHVARVVARPLGRQVALLTAEIPGAGAWNGQAFTPNWYVDIGATLDTKLAALACYRQEGQAFPHPCSPEAVRALASVHGANSGLGTAEAFHLVHGSGPLLP